MQRRLLIVLLASGALDALGWTARADADGQQFLSSITEEHFQAEVRLADGVMIYDLVSAGPEVVGAFVARRFLVEMSTFADLEKFTEVDLAYRGQVRWRIYVGDLRKLSEGYRLGDMSAFHKLMQLPTIVQTLEGKYAFPRREGAPGEVAAGRAADFNMMLDHWFLGELVEELRQSVDEENAHGTARETAP